MMHDDNDNLFNHLLMDGIVCILSNIFNDDFFFLKLKSRLSVYQVDIIGDNLQSKSKKGNKNSQMERENEEEEKQNI